MDDRTIRHISINIMEELVMEEIDRQIKRYSDNIAQYINKVEVATFALNRLPPLYASSHKGLNKQKLKGKSDYSVQITKAVRQAFAAVQKDVLRYSVPLQPEDEPDSKMMHSEELEEARKALAELAKIFPHSKVSWKNIVKLVKCALKKNQEYTKKSSQKNIIWY